MSTSNETAQDFATYLVTEFEKERVNDVKQDVEEFILTKTLEYMADNVPAGAINSTVDFIRKYGYNGTPENFRNALSDFAGNAVGKGFEYWEWTKSVYDLSKSISEAYERSVDGNLNSADIAGIAQNSFNTFGLAGEAVPLIGQFISFQFELAGNVLETGVSIFDKHTAQLNAALAVLDTVLGPSNSTASFSVEDLFMDIDDLIEEKATLKESMLIMSEMVDVFYGIFEVGGYNRTLDSLKSRYSEVCSQIDLIEKYNQSMSDAINNGILNPQNPYSDEFLEEVEKCGIIEALNNYNKRITDAHNITSPLLIDLSGDGFFTIGRANGAYFDLDNNGFAEKTAWIGGNDNGFLVLDINGNGKIDGGFELFGNNTLLKSGRLAKDGFEALQDYDSNNDGIIDANDEIFNELRIWIDDGDGFSEESELYTLAELGIVSISTNQCESEINNYIDAVVSGISNVEFADGRVTTMADFWFVVSQADTFHISDIEISEELMALPDVRSMGNVPSLRVAMAMDVSGELVSLVRTFAETNDITKRRDTLKRILYKITGADNIAPSSRGGNIDARDLHVLESLLGSKYTSQGGNPGQNATSALMGIYNDLFSTYYALLSSNEIRNYLNLIRFKQFDGTTQIDTSMFNAYITAKMFLGEDVSHVIYDVGEYIRFVDNGGDNYQKYVYYYLDLSENNAKLFMFNNSVLIGRELTDTLTGSSANEILVGLGGNDIIYGNSGNDILYGGTGDDMLNGGEGNDTYVFGVNYGNDAVCDSGGANKLKFTNGVKPEDLIVMQSGSNDIVIVNQKTGEKTTIKEFLYSSSFRNFTLEFDDGRTAVVSNNYNELIYDAPPEIIDALENEDLTDTETPINETENATSDQQPDNSLYTQEGVQTENLIIPEPTADTQDNVSSASDALNSIYADGALSSSDNALDGITQNDSQVQNLVEMMASFGSNTNIFDQNTFTDNSASVLMDSFAAAS